MGRVGDKADRAKLWSQDEGPGNEVENFWKNFLNHSNQNSRNLITEETQNSRAEKFSKI